MEDILMHVKLIHEGKSEEQILKLAKNVAIRESDLINIENEYVLMNNNEDEGDGNNNSNKRQTRRFP